MGKTEIDLQSEQTDYTDTQGLQPGRSEDSEVNSSAFADSLMLGETRVYTSGGQVHHIAAESLKIERSTPWRFDAHRDSELRRQSRR